MHRMEVAELTIAFPLWGTFLSFMDTGLELAKECVGIIFF
jgi:hypothetical protein